MSIIHIIIKQQDMVITFRLKANTIYGEEIFISNETGTSQMIYTNNEWSISVKTNKKSFSYHYVLKHIDGSLTEEEETRWITPQENNLKILVFDSFVAKNEISKPMRSAVFANAILSHNHVEQKPSKSKKTITFNTHSDKVAKDYELAICGSNRALRNWSESDPIILDGEQFPKYTHKNDLSKFTVPFEYKYVIFNKKNKSIIAWEEGENRKIEFKADTYDQIIINDNVPNFALPAFKGAGVAIPIFSLRTAQSFGCGEFADLKLLADWANQAGMKIIQTLPINDTTITSTWHDSYPYSAISTMALHPIYINLEQCGKISDKNKYDTLRKKLNKSATLDYEATLHAKIDFLWQIFTENKDGVIATDEFKSFFTSNKEWLMPYAIFCYLRDKYQTSNFNQWGKEKDFKSLEPNNFISKKFKDRDKVLFHIFIQYNLHKQLKEVVEYLHSKGIALKGDIPIGVNKHSVETWVNPAIFDCNGQAGAPPDDFSKTGQNWGFPIYNWDEMQKDGYKWWRKRFEKMSEYFDAYRIDHILGFFRIFRIPANQVIGLLGQFTPSQPMSADEIRNFGFEFDKQKHCMPHITRAIVETIFGDETDHICEEFLDYNQDETYSLKTGFQTQAEIKKHFDGKDGEKDIAIRNGLYALTCQVLFIEDINEKNKFHPRIAVYQSLVFKYLSVAEKEIINKIYTYFYYQRQNDFWEKKALEKLPVLTEATNLLACGEDLGMVPTCVPKVMEKLQMLSLEIQRMPKEIGVEFGNLNNNPYLSVCTTSTHDMSTMRAWWEEDRVVTQRFFNNELNQYGLAPMFCEPWICQQIIEKHLACPSQWVIIPIQDWMAINGKIRWVETFAERINDPANPNNYWQYRMHIKIEELLKEKDLSNCILSIIRQSGR